jgi:hypothetical protein
LSRKNILGGNALSPLHTINQNKVEEGQALIQYDSMEQEQLRGRFREWWWNELDTGADGAEFDAGSAEAAQDLLPILRVLKAPLSFKSVLAILSSFRGWWWVPLRSRKKTLTPALSLNGDFEKH